MLNIFIRLFIAAVAVSSFAVAFLLIGVDPTASRYGDLTWLIRGMIALFFGCGFLFYTVAIQWKGFGK